MQMNAFSFPTSVASPILLLREHRQRLLLSETNRLLDSPRELLRERVVALVRRQVETVEARVRLGQL